MTTNVTDEQIQALAATAEPFSVAVLRWAPERHQDGAAAIELEHQRRMVSMRVEGVLGWADVARVLSHTPARIAIMRVRADDAEAIMAADPCVQAGMMTVEVQPCLGFPGDTLPGAES